MVKIRLKRMGAKKRPFYRLVVADSRSPRDGRFIESIGTYDPLPTPAAVNIDADKVREWMRKGARPSDSARRLLQAQGIIARVARTGVATAPDGRVESGVSEALVELDAELDAEPDAERTVPAAEDE